MYFESKARPASTEMGKSGSSFSSSYCSADFVFAVSVGTGFASSAAHTPPQIAAAQVAIINFFMLFLSCFAGIHFPDLLNARNYTISAWLLQWGLPQRHFAFGLTRIESAGTTIRAATVATTRPPS